jgi:hypothetical protein
MAVDERINLYGIAIQELYNGGLELYGIGIQNPYQHGLELYGMAIEALNVFNGDLVVTNNSFEPISGATVNLTSTQTLPGTSAGNISGTTDSEGNISLTGSSTVGTSVTITHSDHHTVVASLPGMLTGGTTVSMPTKEIQRVKVTNRGNILINPNDTILIELD